MGRRQPSSSLSSLAAALRAGCLIVLGGLLVAIAVAVGSGANFNSTRPIPARLITTGTVVVTDSLAGQSILTVNVMKPGGSELRRGQHPERGKHPRRLHAREGGPGRYACLSGAVGQAGA